MSLDSYKIPSRDSGEPIFKYGLKYLKNFTTVGDGLLTTHEMVDGFAVPVLVLERIPTPGQITSIGSMLTLGGTVPITQETPAPAPIRRVARWADKDRPGDFHGQWSTMWQEDPKGPWCKSEDVAKLERTCDHYAKALDQIMAERTAVKLELARVRTETIEKSGKIHQLVMKDLANSFVPSDDAVTQARAERYRRALEDELKMAQDEIKRLSSGFHESCIARAEGAEAKINQLKAELAKSMAANESLRAAMSKAWEATGCHGITEMLQVSLADVIKSIVTDRDGHSKYRMEFGQELERVKAELAQAKADLAKLMDEQTRRENGPGPKGY